MKKTLLILCASAVLILVSGCAGQPAVEPVDEPPSAEVANRYKTAQDFFARKEYHQSAAILEAALKIAKNREQREKVLFLLAESFYNLHDNDRANQSYTDYLSAYATGEYFNEALTHRFEIGFRWINGETRNFLGFPILSAVDSGIQVVRELLKSYPYAPAAEEYQLKLAEFFYQQKDFENTKLEYESFIKTYPKNPFVPMAHYRIAISQLAEYQGPDYDSSILDRAERKFNTFLEKYPVGELPDEVRNKLSYIKSLKAEREFGIAHYYLRSGHKPAARYCFQRVIDLYPETNQAKAAKEILPTIKD